MQLRAVWIVWGVLVCAILRNGIPARSSETEPADAPRRSIASQVACCGAGEDAKPDRIYASLRRDFFRLRAIWQQQPNNRKALLREISRLREHLAKLSDAAFPKSESPKPTSPAEDGRPKPGIGDAPRPEGPVRPSDRPPTEQEIRKFIEAVEKTHRPGPRGQGPGLWKTVPASWIVQTAAATDFQLRQLKRLVQQSPEEDAKVQSELDRIERLIDRIAAPPEPGSSQPASQPDQGSGADHPSHE